MLSLVSKSGPVMNGVLGSENRLQILGVEKGSIVVERVYAITSAPQVCAAALQQNRHPCS